jgi:hypothetical protein
MRYLFADSEPFPLEYDFLATLRGFLECGATCLAAVAAIDTQESRVKVEKVKAEKYEAALDRFEEDAVSGLEAARSASTLTEAISGAANQSVESIRRIVASTKESVQDELRGVERAARSRVDGQGETIRHALERFLLKERLEVEDTFFEMVLENDGYLVSATCRMPEGLTVQYHLDARRRGEWQRPRKVSELVGDLEVQIGMKKKLFGKALTPDVVKVSDWSVVAATLGTTRASITLRKRPDSDKDTTIIALRRTEHGVRGEVRRGVELGGERESIVPSAPDDAGKLSELWDALDRECLTTLAHRESVGNIRLDGEDILEGRQVVEFIERYVDMYKPIVSEIAQRSPSAKELSLKIEHDDGHREEIYLRREELADVVAPLDDQQMKVFAPLDFFPEIDIELL